MASNDGFIPYPIGLSATQSVQGIKNGYQLHETLKNYSNIVASLDPPDDGVVYNQCQYWYSERNSKLYKAMRNESANMTVWIEV